MTDTIIQLAINGLLLGGIYALISVGLTLIFGVLEVVNFAHGEFLMISMYLTYWLFTALGIDPYVSLMIVVPVSFLLGFIVHKILVQPLLNDPPLNLIFATLGLSLIFQNLALILFKADYLTVTTKYSGTNILLGEIIISLPRLTAFILASGIVLLLFLFLKSTFAGKAIRALAQQRKAAMLMGINVYQSYTLAFCLGIACVGAAGSILMPIFYVYPTVGGVFGLIAFVVVVLGGYNSLVGSLIAGLIIGVIESFSGFFISPHLKEAVYFAIFIFILIYRPTGLLGRKA
jgi:branched-chain amino acid transport system permease protein